MFTGNIENYGIIEAKYGDRRTGSDGITSGRGGNGVIAHLGYRVEKAFANALSHYHWKNCSFIFDGRNPKSTETSVEFNGNEFGLIAIPSKDATTFDIAYGNFVGDFTRSNLKLSYNEWIHIGIMRKDNQETLYINGNVTRTRTSSVVYTNTASSLGSQAVDNFKYPLRLHGFLQDVRITRKASDCFDLTKSFGQSKHLIEKITTDDVSNPMCSDIAFEIRSNTTTEDDVITDISSNEHPITNLVGVTHSTESIISGESSFYFDGNNNSLSVGDKTSFNFLHNGSSDYTIECWVNVTEWQTDDSGKYRSHILGTGSATNYGGIWLAIFNDADANGFIFRYWEEVEVIKCICIVKKK